MSASAESGFSRATPRYRRWLFGLAACLLVPAGASAHPHEWIDVATEVLFNDKGAIAAVRHHWRFDEAFTAWALQGLDTNGDGTYSAAELKPLAQENVESVGEYDFFTFISAGDQPVQFGSPRDYNLDLADGRLTLHYTLPLAAPLLTSSEILLQVYDPEYYIAFSLPSIEAVRLVSAPSGCRLEVTPAQGPDGQAAAALATIGADQRELPPEMRDLTSGIDNKALIHCGAPTIGTAGAPETRPQSAEAARPAKAPALLPDLTARPASDVRSSAAPPAPPSSNRLLAKLQTSFQATITEALKSVSKSTASIWWLGGISFLYGIVHAAGPGHGKVVISSYLLANEVRIRRGVSIAFVSAFVQALVAIGIVGLMAVLLNMTSMAMTSTAKILETGSFALVALLGLYLLARKGRQVWSMFHGVVAHALHGHVHAPHGSHAHQQHRQREHEAKRIRWEESAPQSEAPALCNHHHLAPERPERYGVAGVVAAVLSVGLRPCSGALIVLVFALAQGVFWAGVASTFLMALGTAMTVAALAALAVGAKGLAKRLSRGESDRGTRVMLVLEIAASFAVTALGIGLFVGSLQA